MSKLSVPFNTSGILAKLKNVKLGGGTPPKKKESGEPPRDRRTGHEGAEARKKAKELRDKLTSAETSLEERMQLIEQLQNENEQLKTENARLKPVADQWDKYEGVERQKLLKKLPAEYVIKDLKEMPLHLLRTYVQGIAGTSPNAGGGATSSAGKKDWGKIMERNDAQEIDKAIAEDKDGFNAYMDSINK